MPQGDIYKLLGMGGLFLLLGLGAIIWDRVEKNRYYNSLAGRPDTREFLEGWPPRAQFGALKTGGWIAVALGVLMLIMGGAFWLWG
ncbi:hypothetical protein ACFLU1_00890 [Chloroflexota bacterium]